MRQFPFYSYKKHFKWIYWKHTHTHKWSECLTEFKVKSTRLDCSAQAKRLLDLVHHFELNYTTSQRGTQLLPRKQLTAMHRISGWAVHNPQLHSLWKEKFKCALLPSVLLSRTLGHVTPPPDRLKYHLASVIFSLCWYKQTMNKYLFHYYFQFHLRVGCRVVVFSVCLKNNAYFLACKITGFGHQVQFP